MQRALLTLSLAVLATSALAQSSMPKSDDADISRTARWIYEYAYSLASMDATMRQATNVPNASTIPMRAPVNQFANARAYPGANEKDVVRFNFDTLYSLAWIDVSKEPIILSVPNTGGRYYLLEMLDMWSDVFSVVGKRTTGTGAGNFALVNSGWEGTLPEGIAKIVAPTPMFWILGRTQTNGPADYDNVHKVQDGYKLTPLSAWGKGDYTPPGDVATDPSVDNKTSPQTQVNNLTGVEMFAKLAELFAKYPPHANDYPILFEMQKLGLEPGKLFDPSKLNASEVEAINSVGKTGPADLAQGILKIGKVVNGWNLITENIGTYGTSYRQRAMISLGGLGANQRQRGCLM
jgi:hypothetical protein